MIKLITLFTIIAMGYTVNNNGKSQTKSIYYEDLDIYKLKGLNKMNSLTYPCIEIEDMENIKRITYHQKKGQSITHEYGRINSGWFRIYQFRDTSMIYSYEYILQDTVVTFNYSDNNLFLLKDISLITDNKETIYFPPKGLSGKLEIYNYSTIVKDAESKFTMELKIVDSVLIESTTKTNKKGEIIFNTRNCFQNKKRSFIWWTYFGLIYSKEIKCL